MDNKGSLKTKNIKLNKPLDRDIYDARGTLLLCKGYQIDKESLLEELINRSTPAESSMPPTGLLTLNTHKSSFEVWESFQDHLQELLTKPPLDGSFPARILRLGRLIMNATLRSSNAAIAAMMLANSRFYPISHSIHVAFLVNLMAIRLKWTDEERTMSVCAALTMNIAMIRLQEELCHTRTALSEEQKHAIEVHPKVGVSLLQRLGVEDDLWLQAVLEHHEIPGGEGYPNKIVDPCQQALVIRTCDIFSAKISPRATRRPMDAAQAAKVLFVSEGIEAKNPYSALLIKEVGIYPPGSIVRLKNNEIAIVTRRGKHAHAPIVRVLQSAAGHVVTDMVTRDTSFKEFAVHCSMLREELSIPVQPQKIWP